MRIVILGAGQVGSSVAQNLSQENNDITAVDSNEKLLTNLRNRMDIKTVHGHASHPDVLEQAGLPDAEMLIAVTNSDEVNIVACQIAYGAYRTPQRLARIRSPSYSQMQPSLFDKKRLAIDVVISPEELVTNYVSKLILNPGALQVLSFAEGRVSLVGVRAAHGGVLVNKTLKTLAEHMPGVHARVGALYRNNQPIMPDGNTIIQPNDEVFFVAAPKNIRAVMSELRRLEKPTKRIMIAGGGNIGARLAQSLEQQYQIKLIERDKLLGQKIAETLTRTIVLEGNATDERLLLEENIENVDVFCAVTNDDEVNILSALLAKRRGAKKVMALINNPAYVELMEEGGLIDAAISPQQATIGSLLSRVRRGEISSVHSLRRGAAEAIEATARGDAKVVNKRVEEIPLPPGTSIAALVRGNEVIICHHDTEIKDGDHVILFMVNKAHLRAVEALFHVSPLHF